MLRGVKAVRPGYAGGSIADPAYEQVSSGRSGHAEVIKIDYDPAQITYHDLLTVFFASHDPTTLNRQGADVGSQYRSVIFYLGDEQRAEAEQFIKNLGDGIVTEVRPLVPDQFYPAEEDHRDYYAQNPGNQYCQLVINPKLEKVQQNFATLLKTHGEP